MTDLEHDLASAAKNIHLTTGDVDMVVSRGRKRRARRQQVIGGVTALALVAGVAGLLNRDPAPTPVNASAPISQGDAKLHWEALSTSDGIGWADGLSGDGPYYAMSTAPGRADVNKQNPSRVLWRSDDGVEWTAAATLGDDLFLSDLAPADGRVYAVGTAPAQSSTKHKGDLVAGWSDDGGKTFSKQALPIDWSSLDSKAKQIWSTGTQIASTKTGTVVVAGISASFDVPAILPDGVTAPDGWATTANGVDILGPDKGDAVCPAGTTNDPAVMKQKASGALIADAGAKRTERPDQPRVREVESTYCYPTDGNGDGFTVSPQDARGVVRSVGWNEMGISGDLLAAASHQPFAFFAPAGSTNFSRVDLGNVSGDMSFLDADDAGFHLLTTIGGGKAISTTDLASTDGQHWTSAAGPVGLSWVQASGSVNGLRVVIGDAGNGAVISRQGADGSWVTSPLSSVVDASITKGKPINALAAGVGPMGIVIAAMPQSDKDLPDTLILSSRDGSTFETKTAEGIAGHAIGTPLHISVSGQRAVVALSGGSTEEGKAPKPQTILVATPA